MTSRTLRLLPGGLSNIVEIRLRFIELTATSVEPWTVDDLDLVRSNSDYVFVSILAWE